MIDIQIFSSSLLAIVFAYSSVAKLRGGGSFHGFRAWVEDLPIAIAQRHAGALAAAVAGAEALIVILVVLPWTVLAGFALAGATLTVFIAGTCLAIARGTKATCNCFGTRGAPLGRRHVERNIFLLAVAIVGAVASDAHGAHPAGIVLSVATAAVVALLVVALDDVLSIFAAGPPNTANARRREG
jgi:hypothetical protein